MVEAAAAIEKAAADVVSQVGLVGSGVCVMRLAGRPVPRGLAYVQHAQKSSTHTRNAPNTETHHTQAHAPEYLQWLNELLTSSTSNNSNSTSNNPIPFPRATPFRPQTSQPDEGQEGGEEPGASGGSGFVLRPDALVGARRAAGAVLHAVDQVVSSECFGFVGDLCVFCGGGIQGYVVRAGRASTTDLNSTPNHPPHQLNNNLTPTQAAAATPSASSGPLGITWASAACCTPRRPARRCQVNKY